MPPTTPGDPKYMVTEAMIISRSWHRRQAPFFRVESTARVFFAMSSSWLRLKMNPDAEHPDTWFVKDGQRMEFRRLNPDKASSARVFTLADIEPMAYSLARFGAIDSQRLMQILDVVTAMATLYGLFDEPPTVPGEDEGAENDALVES